MINYGHSDSSDIRRCH